MSDLTDVYAWIDAHADDAIARLQTLARQPSVAAQGVGMAETAALVESMLAGIGAEVRQVDVPGGYPVVYAELPGASGKTLSLQSREFHRPWPSAP